MFFGAASRSENCRKIRLKTACEPPNIPGNAQILCRAPPAVRQGALVPPDGGLESRWDSRKRLCFIHVKTVLSLPYKTYNRAMEHTRFLLLTHKKHFCVAVVSSRIETVQRRIAECTSRNTPCVLLSFPSSFQICHVPEWHQNTCTWTMPTLSLPSFPTHVLPVLSVRNHSRISCVLPKTTTSLRVEILLPADWDSKFYV